MKKYVFLLLASFIALLLASCDTGPKFQYDLVVDGQVKSQSVPVECEFNASVTNTVDGIFLLQAVDTSNIVSMQALPQDADIVKDFDAFIQKSVIDKAVAISNDAKYRITVQGYVSEAVTGLIVKVDKTFTNDVSGSSGKTVYKNYN